MEKEPEELSGQNLIYKIETNVLRQSYQILKDQNHHVALPTGRDWAIIYHDISGLHDLLDGWQDEQEAGGYRIRKTNIDQFFAYAASPHSLKKIFATSTNQVVARNKNPGK